MINKGWCGPRRLDPHQQARIKELSLSRYRIACQPFIAFLDEYKLNPCTAEEFDDLIVEFKNIKGITKSQFESLIAAIEFLFPRFKFHLSWAHSVATGWATDHIPKHAKPMGKAAAALLASQMAFLQHHRLGIGMFLQQQYGMRPAEMLRVIANDCLCSHFDSEPETKHTITIRLGAFVGTKSKREQFVIVRRSETPEVFVLLLRVIAATAGHIKLFPYSYSSYRRLIIEAEAQLGVNLQFTPHSPRAGYASEGIAAGKTVAHLMSVGRWSSESSFKIYVDVITALHVANSLRQDGLQPACAFVMQNLLAYFPQAILNAKVHGPWHTTRQERPEAALGGSTCLHTATHSPEAVEPNSIWQDQHAHKPQSQLPEEATSSSRTLGASRGGSSLKRGGGRGNTSLHAKQAGPHAIHALVPVAPRGRGRGRLSAPAGFKSQSARPKASQSAPA
jgi:hypothetical protein